MTSLYKMLRKVESFLFEYTLLLGSEGYCFSSECKETTTSYVAVDFSLEKLFVFKSQYLKKGLLMKLDFYTIIMILIRKKDSIYSFFYIPKLHTKKGFHLFIFLYFKIT